MSTSPSPEQRAARVVLGVDSGASKTSCAILDLDSGLIIGEARSGSGNRHSIACKAAEESLDTALNDALKSAGLSWHAVSAISCGVSGVDTLPDTQYHRRRFRRMLDERGVHSSVPCYVYNDAVAALAAANPAGIPAGIAAIAGTGSIVVGAAGPRRARALGWGPAFRDAGSGVDIAQRGMAAAAAAHDGRGPATDLVFHLPASVGVPNMSAVMRWAYEDQAWSHVAALAPTIVRCAAGGDVVATGVLDAAAHELAAAIRTVAMRLQGSLESDWPVILAGGLVADSSGHYFEMVKAAVRSAEPGRQCIRLLNADAAVGAAKLGRYYLKTGIPEGHSDVVLGILLNDAHGEMPPRSSAAVLAAAPVSSNS